MKVRAVVRAWAVELWLSALYEPWKALPHAHRPRWLAAGGEYACERCGSSSARVQRKGREQARGLRREMS